MKKALFIFLTTLCTLKSEAQLLNKMYSSSNFFDAKRSTRSSTGGHFLMYQPMAGGSNLLSLDASGNILWNKAYENNSSPLQFNDFCEVSGSKLIAVRIAGNIESMTFNSSTGAPISHDNRIINAGSVSYSGPTLIAPDGNDAIFVSPDGSRDSLYIGKILGSNASISYINVINLNGILSTDFYYSPSALKRTSAGQYFILCDIRNSAYTIYKQAIAKIDANGNVLFFKYFDCPTGTVYWYGSSITEASNGDILVSGYANLSSTTGSYMLRFDANANFLWGKHVLNQAASNAFHAEHANGDITLGMSAQAFSPDNVTRCGLVNMSSSGAYLWARNYGFSGSALCGINTDANDLTEVIQNAPMTGPGAFVLQTADLNGNMPGCTEAVGPIPMNNLNLLTNSASPSTVSASLNLSTPFPFNELPPLTFAAATPEIDVNGVISNPACYGQFGNVNISVSGGYPNYTYSWSNGTSNQNLLNVLGGTYYSRIVDAKGCAVVDTFNVIEPSQLVTTYTVSHVTCFGAQNGSVNVTTSGGTPGYTWQWTTQATTEDLTGLSGGFYQLTITDANNCTKQLAVSVSEPQQLIAGIMSSQNVKCHGACDGSLTGVASGGTQPYSYLWNNPGSATTTTVTGLCPGNYLFSVTDAKNCFTFANAVITEPAALAIASTVSAAHCGSSDGAASAQVSGGVSPYTYSWSSSSTNDTAFSLSSGTYTVNVLDVNNCALSTVVNVGLTTDQPGICLITVDSMSTHNILMWDKTAYTNADYFNIYREDITNNYTLVAAVDLDSLSEYHDMDMTNADPNVTTKRYKISVVDTCGNESAKSNFHNTIFIAHNNGTFTWNTYTIQNSANPVTNYRLMRDDLANGNWQQVGTTAGTQNVLNDPNYATFQATADWRVETIWNITCTSTLRESNGAAATLVKSKSNITNNRVVGITQSSGIEFGMYPNPANETLTIVLDKATSCSVEISNSLGETVRKSSLSGNDQMNISELANGVYYVKILNEGKQLGIKKLVVQR